MVESGMGSTQPQFRIADLVELRDGTMVGEIAADFGGVDKLLDIMFLQLIGRTNPDSIRSCGVRMAPQQTMTSLFVFSIWPEVNSAATAFFLPLLPTANMTRLTTALVITSMP